MSVGKKLSDPYWDESWDISHWDLLPLELQYKIMGETGVTPSFDYDYIENKKLDVLCKDYKYYTNYKYVCCICLEWTSRPGKIYHQILHSAINPNCPHEVNGSKVCDNCYEENKSENGVIKSKNIVLENDYDLHFIKGFNGPEICGDIRSYISAYAVCHDCLERFPINKLIKYYLFYNKETKEYVVRHNKTPLDDDGFFVLLYIMEAYRCNNCMIYKPIII